MEKRLFLILVACLMIVSPVAAQKYWTGYLTLAPDYDVQDSLQEGQTKTYTVDGQDYQVTLTYLSSPVIKLSVNGVLSDMVREGESTYTKDRREVSYVYYSNESKEAKFIVDGILTGAMEEGDSVSFSDGTVVSLTYLHPDGAAEVLVDGVPSDTLRQGQTGAVAGRIKTTVVSLTSKGEAKLSVDGKLTDVMEEGESMVLSDGTKVTYVSYSDYDREAKFSVNGELTDGLKWNDVVELRDGSTLKNTGISKDTASFGLKVEGASPVDDESSDNDDIPSRVLAKVRELSEKHQVKVDACIRRDRKVFVVSPGPDIVAYSGTNYYYDSSGRMIGTYSWSDALPIPGDESDRPSMEEPPIDVLEYECRTVLVEDKNEDEDTVCTAEYDPVCGSNGRTYSNECTAKRDQVRVQCEGQCPCDVDDDEMCVQVITPAINPNTGDCREFPTPCDVPDSWARVNSCEDSEPRPQACQGCEVDGRCVQQGTRLEQEGVSVYCNFDGGLNEQKDDGSSCQNNYECLTNECSSGECVDLQAQLEEQSNLLQRILDWLGGIFG